MFLDHLLLNLIKQSALKGFEICLENMGCGVENGRRPENDVYVKLYTL